MNGEKNLESKEQASMDLQGKVSRTLCGDEARNEEDGDEACVRGYSASFHGSETEKARGGGDGDGMI